MTDTSSDRVDWIARAGTRAKGRRPDYCADPVTDRILSMVMALMGEVSVLRERLDTVERLLDAQGHINRADIETYVPDSAAGHERGVATKAYIARVMRAMQQELEAMQHPDPPVEHWVDELAKR